jgi:hypothetical protein
LESPGEPGPQLPPPRGFDWLAIFSILAAIASIRCQLTIWLWKFESPYMLRISPRGYLVTAPILATIGLGLAMRHLPSRGGRILRVFAGLVLLASLGTLLARSAN